MRDFIRRYGIAVFAALLVGGAAIAQTSNYLPIPSNVCTAKGGLLVAQDINNATCIAAPASGQVLTSAGAATLPAWSGALSLDTSLTLGASGTAITQIAVYSVEVNPEVVAAQTCAEQAIAVTGLESGDRLLVSMAEEHSDPVALVSARYSDDDVAAVTFCNPSASTASPTTGTMEIVAVRS